MSEVVRPVTVVVVVAPGVEVGRVHALCSALVAAGLSFSLASPEQQPLLLNIAGADKPTSPLSTFRDRAKEIDAVILLNDCGCHRDTLDLLTAVHTHNGILAGLDTGVLPLLQVCTHGARRVVSGRRMALPETDPHGVAPARFERAGCVAVPAHAGGSLVADGTLLTSHSAVEAHMGEFVDCLVGLICRSMWMRVAYLGSVLPSFHSDAVVEGVIQKFSLSTLRGKHVVLCCVSHPLSPQSAAYLTQLAQDFPPADDRTALVVVATASVYSLLHLAAISQIPFPFPLVADSTGSICGMCGCFPPSRSELILAPSGAVQYISHTAPGAPPSFRALVRALRTAQGLDTDTDAEAKAAAAAAAAAETEAAAVRDPSSELEEKPNPRRKHVSPPAFVLQPSDSTHSGDARKAERHISFGPESWTVPPAAVSTARAQDHLGKRSSSFGAQPSEWEGGQGQARTTDTLSPVVQRRTPHGRHAFANRRAASHSHNLAGLRDGADLVWLRPIEYKAASSSVSPLSLLLRFFGWSMFGFSVFFLLLLLLRKRPRRNLLD
eukprot:CAMPEP_0177662262 /NCGR_PEP_ID=MMETSP0447-20121125/19186_1 /TAXON_ID=0 /ORGANISM="Stygamoeba regulata, Strain BSH-02190019" /LENGTH=549 /DNA_ID=CAMNT_0019167795 /DNA_START=54 /DNA_END=1703 /DNA_ORIENTATION=+